MTEWRRLFVYGTLRRGAVNHAWLARAEARGGARFEAMGRTVARYDLVDLGAYPALLRDGDLAVIGEVWRVDERATSDLDRFEGAPDLFARAPVELDDGSTAEAYVYMRTTGAPRIPSGVWSR